MGVIVSRALAIYKNKYKKTGGWKYYVYIIIFILNANLGGVNHDPDILIYKRIASF